MNIPRILLTCALRAHVKFSVFRNILLRIEKVMTAFSIFEKMFPKIKSLMCVLKAHINRTLFSFQISNFAAGGQAQIQLETDTAKAQ